MSLPHHPALRAILAPLAAAFILASGCAFAQEAPAAPAEAVKSDKSLLDLYHEGGPVMHIIAACSVATVALSLFCFLTQSKKKLVPDALVTALKGQLAARDVNAAATTCRASVGPLTTGLLVALGKINPNRHDLGKNAMENAVADHCFREETKMMVVVNYLNTFAVMAPMIGLLGTTSGMITSFGALTAGKAEASELAGGIGEALVATAGGLFLAIPAMFLYFHFRGQAQTGMAEVHKTLGEMIDILTADEAPVPAA
jgi:biopolymer transport protein ExbB